MVTVGPQQIALLADNGLYLSRINRGATNPIEAAKQNVDVFCLFTVSNVGPNKITLRADNGLYLSRINRGSVNPIEAAKERPDVFCEFAVTTFFE
ncbi:fascin domain-containing protein [Burkholderia ubonensis]|uniref:fascin domain-containing protein n=1 Tax=Burkholderia ubonensis TaxID=101571 RepID=UPI0018DFA074|nr:hypothetical protein [Burkholderia ubonensis]